MMYFSPIMEPYNLICGKHFKWQQGVKQGYEKIYIYTFKICMYIYMYIIIFLNNVYFIQQGLMCIIIHIIQNNSKYIYNFTQFYLFKIILFIYLK